MERLNSKKFEKFESSKIANLLAIKGGVVMSSYTEQGKTSPSATDSATNSGGSWDNVVWKPVNRT